MTLTPRPPDYPGGDRGPVDDVLRLPDFLRAYDHGVGTLSAAGEVVGHLASVVMQRFPSGRPWLWFVIVWSEGSREEAFEDYGPDWPVVRELEAGYLEHRGRSRRSEVRLFGRSAQTITPGPPMRFDVDWLPTDAGRRRWDELGLTDADF